MGTVEKTVRRIGTNIAKVEESTKEITPIKAKVDHNKEI